MNLRRLHDYDCKEPTNIDSAMRQLFDLRLRARNGHDMIQLSRLKSKTRSSSGFYML
ncbi:hypothetical protein [Taibaiella koreensis]|uniref:hypothetical protein n=1 Tax=Taibaiella koreensis TaxID=1268548 RepID=UPI0013C308D9|nr:hypothetical protein [Taibaiella koreensis]